MHSMAQPVLVLDESRLQLIDSTDQKNLHLMWSVFSRASQVMEHGKRFENMSWRLWNAQSQNAHCSRTTPRTRPSVATTQQSASSTRPLTTDVPSLSRSLSSSPASSDGGDDLAAPNRTLGQRTKSVDFETLVHSIKAKQELTRPISPLPIPEVSNPPSRTASNRTQRPSSPRPVEKSSTSTVATTESFNSTAGTSQTSTGSDGSDHSVVRGFAPSQVSSYTSKSQLQPAQPTPILKTSASRTVAPSKKKSGMFMLGGSSGEDESSLKDHMSGRSRNSNFSPISARGSDGSSKKTTSFNERVEVYAKPAIEDNNVFESDDDEDDEEVSESAIDDDDDAWEDDDASETPDAHKPMVFNRVDSSKNLLTSRKSQLALALEHQKRSSVDLPRTPALRRSRTGTLNGPSMPASPTEDSPLEHFQQGKAIKTTTNAQVPTPTLSPRTTRRNMLAGELSASFRQQMIHERSQRQIFTSQVPLRKAHTSVDLSQESSRLGDSRFFETAGYHDKGW